LKYLSLSEKKGELMMAFHRKYETYEVRELLRNAEGVASPVTGQGAHARSLHAKATPGGQGVTTAGMLDRVTKRPKESNKAFKKRDGKTLTSAFPNLILQGAAATQALNSTAGQAALALFDDVNYTGAPLRIWLRVMNIKEHGFLPATCAPSVILAKKKVTTLQTSVTTGVVMIIDRGAGAQKLHIQTCYPDSNPKNTTAWSVTNKATKVDIATG
jgi:hypothetical protein